MAPCAESAILNKCHNSNPSRRGMLEIYDTAQLSEAKDLVQHTVNNKRRISTATVTPPEPRKMLPKSSLPASIKRQYRRIAARSATTCEEWYYIRELRGKL